MGCSGQLFLLLVILWHQSHAQSSPPMLQVVTQTMLPADNLHNPTQLNYGMAVTDVDGNGDLEVVVAGTIALKQAGKHCVDDSNSPYYALRDRAGNAIGVTACDVDGDGREEIYFLNTNNAYSGRATYSDKLFKFRNGRFEDLLSDELNVRRGVANRMAGRSVACIDRKGTGRYSIYVANYASGNVGPHALIEMDEAASDVSKGIIALSDVAAEAGVNKFTGGRGVVVGPILSQARSDIFCDNENGPNFLFKNNGNGVFADMARQAGVEDRYQHGRGVALADFNGDGKTDIVYGNWNGPHRLYLQDSDSKFRNIATGGFATPSPIRTVIAADFDNDKELEVFFNNIAYRGNAPNKLFRVSRRADADPFIQELNVGDAAEPQGRGTGSDEVKVLEVSWPDGSSITRTLQPGEMNSVVEVTYPREGEIVVKVLLSRMAAVQVFEDNHMKCIKIALDDTPMLQRTWSKNTFCPCIMTRALLFNTL
ncbi:hypothetical protein INR49_026450 [Caranx melampygus]|nr:hypothetical protein INR49_026450 [Caranx melampygus]